MFCGIDFMAIWFFLKESVLILLASILTTSFSTDFSKVLTKVKFGPENSIALNEFLEQLLIKHENLEWVDKLQTDFKDIGLANSGLEMRKKISKRNDRRYRKRRKLRPYTNYRNNKNQNFNLDEISHLNIDDYENALTGVLKKEGYKQQRVKQKRYIIETPITTHKYKNHTTFDLLDLSIIKPSKKHKNINYQSRIDNNINDMRKIFATNKSKKQAIIPDDYVEYTERSTKCNSKSSANIKAEELEELLKVVEPTTKHKPNKNHNWSKTKKLGIMNSKKIELTITKSFDIRQKNDLSLQNQFESTTTPIIVIFMESPPTGKTLEKKSITMADSNKTSEANVPVNMISKKTNIQDHIEKDIFLNNPQIEQQIDASPTDANIKSINLNNLQIMTDLLHFTEINVPNVKQPNNLQKREKIVEEDPASVMSPEEIRRAKIEAKKLMDVDKDFNERNEPNFNKELMKPKNNDYKEIYDYWENLKDNVNQKHKSNSIKSEGKMLKSKEKRSEIQQNSFFSRQLLHYNYDNDYENELYSDYNDQENSLRRYPREVNENYGFSNVDDDYFDYQNDSPLKRRFYNNRWKKEAYSKKNEKGLSSKSKLKNKINKLKNFFGIGHENNYNENIDDDYPVENMSIDVYTAKNSEFIDENISNTLSKNPEILQNIIAQQESEILNTESSLDQQSNFESNTFSQNSLSRTIFETKTDNSLISSDSNQKTNQDNENSFESNLNANNLKPLEPSTLKETQETDQTYLDQSTLPTKLTSNQSTTSTQNSVQSDWHRNLEISSIIDSTFSSNYSVPHNDASKTTTTNLTNTQSLNTEKLTLYDFTEKLETTTTPSNPLSYSFTYKMNLLEPKSSSSAPLSKNIINCREKISKRESSFLKHFLGRHKTKHKSKIISENPTTAKPNDNDSIKTPNSKINIDTPLSLDNDVNKKKLTHKYKIRHHPKYHSKWKELLKALPPQIPVAQMHVDELKLNAIKKNQEKNKKTQTNIKTREAADYRADLNEEDYISSENFNYFDDELEHSGLIVKHNVQNTNDSKKCGHKHKTHKYRPDIEEEKNAMKIIGQPKIDGNKKKISNANAIDKTKNTNSLHPINIIKDKKINKQDTLLFYNDGDNDQKNILKHSCQSSTIKKTFFAITRSCPTITTTCSTKHLTTKCPTTTTKCPIKITRPTETCKTTCPTTRRRTTCSTTCKTTTCPTTCKKTTCPTTRKITTCKTTTCPTTHKRTTCPTTCKTTTCPTTRKRTTCPTTTCKTTTCPTTTCKTTYPTTCKTTCPTTTCKTTTCPTTTRKTTTCPTTTCKTTCPTSKTTSCNPLCVHFHSTHKCGIAPWDEANNFLEGPKCKIIRNSQYFDNKNHRAKFNADRLPRHLIFPKKKYLYNDMPKNQYQEMKHKNLIRRLKRIYLPRQNNLIRRKKSINSNNNNKRMVEIPIYKIYPKRRRHQRYRRKKMKSDEAEDEKQRKVLETIYHHRIQRRRNEPEYVRKSHPYDNTIENNVNLPSSYNSEVRRKLIRRTTMDNSNETGLKGTTSSDSTFYSDALLKGKIPAKVVQDLYMDLNKSKNIKNIIGKALRNPRRDPNNPFDTIHKIPSTHQEVTNLLAMYNKLPVTERKRNKYIYNYLHTQKLFLERLIHQFKKYYQQHRNIRLRKRQIFHEPHQHVVWVPNETTSSSEDSNYIKLQKRMINGMENYRNRIKREHHFRHIMRTRRNLEATLTKMDEWMKVKNEEHKPLFLNFTF